jgi:hypothetical protein
MGESQRSGGRKIVYIRRRVLQSGARRKKRLKQIYEYVVILNYLRNETKQNDPTYIKQKLSIICIILSLNLYKINLRF